MIKRPKNFEQLKFEFNKFIKSDLLFSLLVNDSNESFAIEHFKHHKDLTIEHKIKRYKKFFKDYFGYNMTTNLLSMFFYCAYNLKGKTYNTVFDFLEDKNIDDILLGFLYDVDKEIVERINDPELYDTLVSDFILTELTSKKELEKIFKVNFGKYLKDNILTDNSHLFQSIMNQSQQQFEEIMDLNESSIYDKPPFYRPIKINNFGIKLYDVKMYDTRIEYIFKLEVDSNGADLLYSITHNFANELVTHSLDLQYSINNTETVWINELGFVGKDEFGIYGTLQKIISNPKLENLIEKELNKYFSKYYKVKKKF